MGKSMLGFDIGTHEIKIVLWDGERLCRAETVPTPSGLVEDGRITSFSGMGAFLRTALKERQLHALFCSAVIPPAQVLLRRMTLPAMTQRQLELNLPYEFRDYLPRERGDYLYDYIVNAMSRDGEGQPVQLDLTACAVDREIIRGYREMFRQAGLRLKTAVPAECAYANLLRLRGGDQEYCLVDLGHGATRLHIYTGAQFETTRETDVSLQRLSQNGQPSRAPLDGDGPSGPLELYQDIAAEVRKTVNFYVFNHRGSHIEELWCCGGGAQILPLREGISQMLNLPVRSMDELMPPTAGPIDRLFLFAAAAGAAIQ